MAALEQLHGRGRHTDLLVTREYAGTGGIGLNGDVGPARHQLDAVRLVEVEPGNGQHAPERQVTFGLDLERVFARFELDGTEGRFSDLAAVDRDHRIDGWLDADIQASRLLAHLEF